MKRANAVLFSLLMIVSSLAGCIGGEEVDTSEYEDQIAELEEMLEVQNQTIAQREATIDGLEDGLSDATQMIQDHAEGIAILEAYRDSLLVQLENSNNTSAELIVQLESANASIASMQSQIASLESLRDSLSIMLESSNSTIAELQAAPSDFILVLETNQMYLDFFDLRGFNLSGVDLSSASLNRIHATSLQACPDSLNPNFLCLNNNIVGPGVVLTYANLSYQSFPDGFRLADADLSYVNLTGANLTGVDLTGSVTDLRHVRAVDLQGCPSYLLSGWLCVRDALVGPAADLHDVNLSGLDLSDFSLHGANLNGADLTGANMSGVTSNLWYVSASGLQGCPETLPTDWQCVSNTLIGEFARLDNVDLSGLNLSGATFTNAYLRGANLSNSDLTNASLYWITATNLDLSGTNLSGVDLRNAQIENANLSGADMTGADLSGPYTDLTNVVWNNTICPDGTNSDDNGNTCENNL